MTFRARSWILIALLGVAGAYVHFLSDVHAVPLRRPLSSVPLELGEWRGRSFTMEDAIVTNVGVEDYLFREYADGTGYPVNVYVGFYERQREGDTAHSPKHCLPGSGWSPTRSDEVMVDTPGFNEGKTRAVRYVIEKGGEKQVVLYWYQGRGRNTTNEYAAKAYLVIDSIFRKRNDGALIRFMAPAGRASSVEAAEARATALAQQILPLVSEALPE